MASKQQTAVFVTEVGKPVELGTRAVPSPQSTEVLVRVTAGHLLPHDAYGREWGLFVANKLPWVLGSDVAGMVEKIGSGVTSGLKVGDHVFGISNLTTTKPDQAALQQYAILEADALAKVPKSITDDQASTLPINLITAFMSFFTKQGFNFPAPWEAARSDAKAPNLVVIGAGSNLAKTSIRLAKLAGIEQIIAIAASSNETELRKIGASHIIDRHSSNESIKVQVDKIVGPGNVTHILDCYSFTYELGIALSSTTKTTQFRVVHRLDPEQFKLQNPHIDAGYIQCSNANLSPHAAEFWKRVPGWLDEGVIHPAPLKVIDGLKQVAEINKVLDDYRDGKGGPQPVVHP